MNPSVASWLPTLIFVPLVAFALYRRLKRTFGRQPVTPKRMVVRMVLLSVISVVFVASMPTVNGFTAAAVGTALGATLAFYGLKHARYDVTDATYYVAYYAGVLRKARGLDAAGLLLLAFALANGACQSATSGGGTGPSCALPSGTFVERFSGDDSGAGCPTLTERTFVLDGTESPGNALGNTDAGYGLTRCATDVDPSSCAYSANCTTTVDGGTTLVVFTTVTFDGNSARGEQTIESNTCSTDTCTYAITITRGD